MKTLKYISKAVEFFKSFNINTENTADQDIFESTHTRFGINLNQDSTADKAPRSLLSLMYSEENETLFI